MRKDRCRELIDYVFDRGDDGEDQVLVAFRASNRDENLLGSRLLKDKKKFVPLQVADVLAYEIYRFTKRLHVFY